MHYARNNEWYRVLCRFAPLFNLQKSGIQKENMYTEQKQADIFQNFHPAYRCRVIFPKTSAIDIQILAECNDDRDDKKQKQNGNQERARPETNAGNEKNSADQFEPWDDQCKQVNHRVRNDSVRKHTLRKRIGSDNLIDGGKDEDTTEDTSRDEHEIRIGENGIFHCWSPTTVVSIGIPAFCQPSQPSSYNKRFLNSMTPKNSASDRPSGHSELLQ